MHNYNNEFNRLIYSRFFFHLQIVVEGMAKVLFQHSKLPIRDKMTNKKENP